MKRALLNLALAASAALVAPAVGAVTLPPGYDDNPSVVEAVAKARESGKPVIIYVAERVCQVCQAIDGWLVRGDVRQAYKDSYHFAVVFADDMVPEERARWRATYSPRGAPSWVVLASDGSYVCTANGAFANGTAALELHKLLSKVASRPVETLKVSDGPSRPRSCNANALGA